MNELRWILLVLGLLFCLGLWWWESRRGRQAADAGPGTREGIRDGMHEGMHNSPASPGRAPAMPRWDRPASGLERDALGMSTSDLVDAKLRVQNEPDIPARTRFATQAAEDPPMDPPVAEVADFDGAAPGDAARRRIEPTMGPVESGNEATMDLEAPAEEAPAENAARPAQERIVTVRVASRPTERFEGAALVHALGEAGLEHGRFSIFHRVGAMGETLFSVASLVEPGTFDLQSVEGRRYPGVSFFTVLRRPAEALEVFDEMMNTAREFAHQLQGVLQDERGAPLSLQRLAAMREEVAAWQRESARSRLS